MLYDGTGVLWHIPAYTVIGFALLILFLRLAGKRTVAQFNMYDMILSFTVGSILSSFIIFESVRVVDAALSLASIIAVDYAISWAAMGSTRFRGLIKAPPTLLVYEGTMQRANMRRERVVEDEVMMFMRQNGIDRLSEVMAMVMESSGEISVFTADGEDRDMAQSLRDSGVDVPTGDGRDSGAGD